MRLFYAFILIVISYTCALAEDVYEVVNFYQKVEIPNGLLVKGAYGDFEQPSLMIMPTEVQNGTYEVKIEYVADDFWRIDNSNLIIELKHNLIGLKSMSKIYYTKFFLQVENSYLSKGKLICKGMYD